MLLLSIIFLCTPNTDRTCNDAYFIMDIKNPEGASNSVLANFDLIIYAIVTNNPTELNGSTITNETQILCITFLFCSSFPS